MTLLEVREFLLRHHFEEDTIQDVLVGLLESGDDLNHTPMWFKQRAIWCRNSLYRKEPRHDEVPPSFASHIPDPERVLLGKEALDREARRVWKTKKWRYNFGFGVDYKLLKGIPPEETKLNDD